MRMLITGVRDGKSCVVQEFDGSGHGDGISSIPLLEYSLASLPPRPEGRAQVLNLGVPEGLMRWSSVRFPPNEYFGNHSTNSIDFLTVVAGGETSGAVLDALHIRMLTFGEELDPGVPWTSSLEPEGFVFALKSGNFGSPDFFVKALERAR